MSMRIPPLAAALALVVALPAAAQAPSDGSVMYRCPGNDYSNTITAAEAEKRRCKKVENAAVTIIQPADAASAPPPPPAPPAALGDHLARRLRGAARPRQQQPARPRRQAEERRRQARDARAGVQRRRARAATSTSSTSRNTSIASPRCARRSRASRSRSPSSGARSTSCRRADELAGAGSRAASRCAARRGRRRPRRRPPARRRRTAAAGSCVSSAIAASAIEICSAVVAWAQRWCWWICSSLFLLPLVGLVLELLGVLLDRVLLALVALDLVDVERLARLGRELDRQLGEVLLAALGLVVVPLVRGFGLLDRRLVLVQAGVGLRQAAHVGEQRADGGDDRGRHREPPGHAVRLGLATRARGRGRAVRERESRDPTCQSPWVSFL